MINYNQKTLKENIELEGVGLHNGVKVQLTLKPAKPNFGIKFVRTDIDRNNEIEANYKNVVSPILCTRIENKFGASVSTIEHLMAAFYGEGVDNVLVELNASEVPIMDGSSFDFVEAIKSVGTKIQNIPRKFIKVTKKLKLEMERNLFQSNL